MVKQLVRDLMIVGAVSALGAPGAFALYRPNAAYFVVVVLVAVATAPLVAFAYMRAAGDARQQPATMLVPVAVLMGLLWGLCVGAAGGFAEPDHAPHSAELAALSGALQLGWLGAPLIRRATDGRRTWPFLVGAAAVAPLLGNAAWIALGLATRWWRLIGF